MRQAYQKPGRPRPPMPTAQERMERKRKAKEQRQAQQALERRAAEEQKLATLGFDYSGLDEVKRDRLQLAVFNIRRCERRAVEDLITIGQELIAVKTLMPDKFTEWIDKEFGYSNGSAHDFMNMARRHLQFPNFGNLGISSARLLSAPSIPDAAIVEACRIAETEGKITLAETKRIVGVHKREGEPSGSGRKPKQLPGPVLDDGPSPEWKVAFEAGYNSALAQVELDDYSAVNLPDAIDAEYTVIEPSPHLPTVALRPELLRKLVDGAAHKVFMPFLTRAEHDELLIALTRALEEEE